METKETLSKERNRFAAISSKCWDTRKAAIRRFLGFGGDHVGALFS